MHTLRINRLQYPFNRFLKVVAIATTWFLPLNVWAQSPFEGLENLFAVPLNYTVTYAKQSPVIDGDLNDPIWQQARWTTDFVDIEGDIKSKPALQTKVKMLWGDSCLYIAAEITDPNVWATLKQHDQIIFRDNDFEVFIDPSNTTHQYFELEFNALNTVFDLFLNKPYRNLGNAMINWDAEGLRSAVKVQGTLNDASDTDKGWAIEIALPFKAISLGNDVRVPKAGDFWRINFSRVEWDTKVVDGKYIKQTDNKGHNLPEHNWVWSPQGVVNMHYPERWGYLVFTKQNSTDSAFTPPYAEQQKQYLWLVYYREKLWENQHHAYISSLKKCGLKREISIGNHINTLSIEATKHQFMALIKGENDKITWTINQEGLIHQLNDNE